MGLPLRIAQVLPALEFEARKDAAQMVGAVLRLDNGGDCPGTQYLQANPQLLTVLFEGYIPCAKPLPWTCMLGCSIFCEGKHVRQQHVPQRPLVCCSALRAARSTRRQTIAPTCWMGAP